MTKALIIISPTNIDLKNFEKNYFIVGVERGCLELIKQNINIDLAISDFDQVSKAEKELIKLKTKEYIELNPEKYYLDGISALEELKKRKYDDITMIVNPSKRYDMNLSILEYVFNYNLTILNDDSIIFKLNPGKNILNFNNFQEFTYVSFFAKENLKISIKNLKYEVDDLFLIAYSTRAFSNCFIPYKNAIITLDKELIVIMTK
ncbi:thiamine diphosphokinase [Spiroplasma taiwanense]|uniref:Thiamine diphosphokinase n=1 Tax=Spiroplasma taiwanense CT-1 TaxID=1276220 RepID=S5LY45_9MOLU|nr:thiamine diphosphokinase [Spiroplasma taiwanense]AGR41521.1 thiamine pyrophosphokinase [Spiroplasma taiwanense CT-1]